VKNETIGFEGIEISELIRELRIEKKVKQAVLYSGLCNRKVYFQLENGDVIMDELLSERLFSRLHVQYRLLDIMLSDENFWQKECRYEIDVQVSRKCWKKAQELLKAYEARMPHINLHRQYVLEKRAEISYMMKQENVGVLFREALELTMTVAEVEKRLQGSGIISEDELWMYFRYKSIEKSFSLDEYSIFLKSVEKLFLVAQIYVEVYFEAAYQYACILQAVGQYILCREICKNAIAWLKRGSKKYHLAEFYFLEVKSGMSLKHNENEEKEFYQKCKMAYYVSMSFLDREVANKIADYCRKEWKWHITD